MNKELTCFYSDGVEYQTSQPIAQEAESRGYKVKFSDNPHEKAEIGLYCQHIAYPSNSKLSVVMLHDMAQTHGYWPNIWKREPWKIYDIGILPGPAWEERWMISSRHPFTRPRIGVIKGGWPKADILKKQLKDVSKDTLRAKYGIQKDKPVILYAPSWENDNKQDEFVQSLMHLDVELVIKQAPWSDSYAQILQNIEEMKQKHTGLAPNIHILDPKKNIFEVIALSDILVSEESSIMFEALLLDVPSIAVTNWMIPDTTPPRNPCIPYDFVIKTTKEELRITVRNTLKNIDEEKKKIADIKKLYFYSSVNSSKYVVDAIDLAVQGRAKDIPILQPNKKVNKWLYVDIWWISYRNARIKLGQIAKRILGK